MSGKQQIVLCSAFGDTGGGRDDGGEGPVVEWREADPSNHEASGEAPSSDVFQSVGSGFSSEFPESGEVHIENNY